MGILNRAITMLKLIFVDDEPDILELVKISLELDGFFKVSNCLSGGDAISRANEFMPDLFLLDVVMRDLSGPETMQKLREIMHLKDVPVIFLTACVSDAVRTELLNLGAKEVITKPFDPLALGAQITEALQN